MQRWEYSTNSSGTMIFEECRGVHPLPCNLMWKTALTRLPGKKARVSCSTHLQVSDSCNVFINKCMWAKAWYPSVPVQKMVKRRLNGKVPAPTVGIFNFGRSLGNYVLKIILRSVIPTVTGLHPGTCSWRLFFGHLSQHAFWRQLWHIIYTYMYIYNIHTAHIFWHLPTALGQIFWHLILQSSCDILTYFGAHGLWPLRQM